MPNRSDVPRPLIALIYNAAAMRRLDPELDLAKRTPGQVDDGNELTFGSDCAAAFSAPSLFGEPQRTCSLLVFSERCQLRGVLPRAGVDRNVRLTEDSIQHLGRCAAGLPPPPRL